MFEARLLGFGAIIDMKTGEEGGTAFRDTFCCGESPDPIFGRLRSRIEVGFADDVKVRGGVGIGGRS